MQVHELHTTPATMGSTWPERHRAHPPGRICARGLESALHFDHRVTGVARTTTGDASGGDPKRQQGVSRQPPAGLRRRPRRSGSHRVASTDGPTETFAVFNVEFDSPSADLVRAPGPSYSIRRVDDPRSAPGFWRVVWPQHPAGRRPLRPTSPSGCASHSAAPRVPDRRAGPLQRPSPIRQPVPRRPHLPPRRRRPPGDSDRRAGLNTGLQDVNNLCWKLAKVTTAPPDQGSTAMSENGCRSPASSPEIWPIATAISDAARSLETSAARRADGAQIRSRRHRWQLGTAGRCSGSAIAPAARPRRLRAAMSALRPDVPRRWHPDLRPDGPLHWPDDTSVTCTTCWARHHRVDVRGRRVQRDVPTSACYRCGIIRSAHGHRS